MKNSRARPCCTNCALEHASSHMERVPIFEQERRKADSAASQLSSGTSGSAEKDTFAKRTAPSASG